MKNLIILILGIIYSFSCIGQQSNVQQKPVSAFVNLSLPKNTEKLTKEKLSSLRNSKLINRIYTKNTEVTGDFYAIEDNIIFVNSEYHTKLEKDILAKRKILYDGVFGSKAFYQYTSSLKMINGNQVLTTNMVDGDYGYYRAYCVNNTNTSIIVVAIEYKHPDKQNAAVILDGILKNLKFK